MNRQLETLRDHWTFTKPGAAPQPVNLPHSWNAVDGQDGGNDYFRGTCTYETMLSFEKPVEDSEVFLEFCGAAMSAEVFVNGTSLAKHSGGYSTFRVNVTDVLTGEDQLKVAVDNGENDTVYPQKADFTFYGGLYRDVNLITVPKAHFALSFDGTPGLHVTPIVSEDLTSAAVTFTVYTENADGQTVTFEVPGVGTVSAISEGGKAKATLTIANVHLWNGVHDPYLYTATATLDSGDQVTARFGCRRFHTDPRKGFYLNGKPYPLRGVSMHQDRKGLGNAITPAENAEDMRIVKEIGATTLRLAHYQHSQNFYDLCDENGLVVWAEIPYITQHMTNGNANTQTQLRELVTQCYNHPSILCWGLSNEITASPCDDAGDLVRNHRALQELCHTLDKTRPTTMAHAFMLETDSEILSIPDLNSYNIYYGWYLGELTQNESFIEEFHASNPDLCLGISEYGADANVKFHSDAPEKGDYTEEYQCLYHEHMLDVFEKHPYLWATHAWNLFDFAADGRDEGGKKGENQKGLVTFDRALKKDAFYLYKAYWNTTEPFVHLCGKRFVDRTGDTTLIKVYSNKNSITLFVDGKEFETKSGSRIFTFNVPIHGEHTIDATACGSLGTEADDACDLIDTLHIRRVEEDNPDYSLGRKGNVANWFDEEDYHSDCYSIRDNFGVLMRNPQTAPIIKKLMDRMIESRGDVAKAANQNANLQKMLAGMTLQALLKQAGDAVPEAMVRQLNAALQQIKK